MQAATHIFLSFVISGIWIACATWIAEKRGSRVGGLLANLPSNLLVSLIFMSLLRGPGYAAQAAAAVPVGMAMNSVYLTIFNALVGRSLVLALAGAVSVHAVAAVFFFSVPLSRTASLLVYVVVLAATFFINEKIMRIKTPPPRPPVWSTWGFVLRIAFSGTMVASVVAVAQLAPPWITGIVSTFPAVMTSSVVILTLTQRPLFARSTSKFLILSSPNVLVYAAIVQVTFPVWGMWAGTLFAYAGSVVFVTLLYPFIRRL